jgi:hypothetical protein
MRGWDLIIDASISVDKGLEEHYDAEKVIFDALSRYLIGVSISIIVFKSCGFIIEGLISKTRGETFAFKIKTSFVTYNGEGIGYFILPFLLLAY